MLKIQSFDERRNIVIPGDARATVEFAVQHWIETAQKAISARSYFSVALSGGSTPSAIYQALALPQHAHLIDWSKVYLFWSDERAAPPDHPDSNYHMAMKSGLSRLAIPPTQIFRMIAEKDIEAEARAYETNILNILGPHLFDLVMLGVGEDGHTASLFPNTQALENDHHLVAANFIPEKKAWRMTLTFSCINQSRATALYTIGASKQTIIKEVLHSSLFPASRIGTARRKALWILDQDAAALLT